MRKEENNEEDFNYFSYEYRSFRNEEGVVARGVLNLPLDLSLPVGHTNEVSGNQISISEFGAKEYQCFGTCLCEKSSLGNRKASTGSIILTRGVSFVVGAISSIMAVNFAKKQFEKECKSTFINNEDHVDNCMFSTISSKVDSCDETARDIDDLKSNQENNNIDEKNMRFFQCIGKCQINHLLKKKEAIKEARKRHCHAMEVDGSETVNCEDLSDSECLSLAKKSFFENTLNENCRSGSYEQFFNVCPKRNRIVGIKSYLCNGSEKQILCEEGRRRRNEKFVK